MDTRQDGPGDLVIRLALALKARDLSEVKSNRIEKVFGDEFKGVKVDDLRVGLRRLGDYGVVTFIPAGNSSVYRVNPVERDAFIATYHKA